MTGATFILNNGYCRREATRAIAVAHEGSVVKIGPPTRSLDQNARLHAMLSDIAKTGFEHDGRKFDVEDLKTLFVSTWQIETGKGSDLVRGFSGELVQLRRSTAKMSKEEIGEVMIIVERFCAERNISLKDAA